MEFRLLGDLEVVEGGRRLPLGGRKQRTLLAALVLDANHLVAADVLIETLWGQGASPKAPGNLHALVSRLRKTLGAERIEHHAGGYLLRVQDSEVDLSRFERLRAEARLLPPRAASERLRNALDLWRGPALADFTYDAWAGSEIQRIEELRVAALEERVEADLEAGKHTDLVGELQGLVAKHVLREGFRRQLIVALYRSGRQAEALSAYGAARKMLDEELGLQPSAELKKLEGAVLRQDPALAAPASRPRPAPRPAQRSHHSRLWIVTASALLAFGSASAVVLLFDREEGRRAAAAAPPAPAARDAPITRGPIAATAKPKTRIVVRTVARPTRGSTSAPRGSAAADPERTASPSRPQATPKRRSTRTATRPRKPNTPTAPGRPPPPPPPSRVADRFDDGVIARDIWTSWVSGTGVQASEQEGRLEMTLGADAVAGGDYNLISAAYGTTCRFLGDFDVRVDYELLDWPGANGVAVQIAAFFGNSVLNVGRQSGPWGESYTAWHGSRGNSLATADSRGGLRIARIDGRATTYHRVGASWALVTRFEAGGAPSIGLQVVATADQFAHQPVRVAFDNFEVTAAQPVC